MVEVQTLVFLGHEATIIQMTITFQFQPSCQLRRLHHKLSQLHQNVHSLIVHKVVKQRFLCFNKIKIVKGVSCVSQCLSAPSVPNVPHVATEISVGGRLQSFWQVWQR